MKIYKMQRQRIILDKSNGTLTRFGMSVCSFKDVRKIPGEGEFEYEKARTKGLEREWIEDGDFFDEDSE